MIKFLNSQGGRSTLIVRERNKNPSSSVSISENPKQQKMSSFNFLVNNMRTLVDAFATLGLADHKGDATFSPEMFCLMADSNVSIHSAIGLQLWPPFFDHYFCRDLKNSWFFFSEIFPLAQYLKDFGYTSFSFSIGRDPHHAQIEFQGPTSNFFFLSIINSLLLPRFDFFNFVF